MASRASRQPWFSRPARERRLVLDETVAVGVAAGVDPAQGGLDGLAQQLEELEVAGPHDHLADEQQVERGRVDGAVVGRVGDGLEGGELAAAQLVQDFAGLLLAEGVVGAALQAREKAHGVDRRARVEHERLEAGDDRVAPEGRHEPGHGGRVGAAVLRVHGEHAQVGLAAAQHAGHLLGVGEDAGRAGEGALVVAAHVGEARRKVAVAQGWGVGHGHLDREAHHLAFARREAHTKARRAAPQAGRRLGKAHDRLAQHLVEAVVGERQGGAVDLGRQARAALVAARAAHLEHVAKVGVEGELYVDLDRRRVVVLDAQQLVDAVRHEPRAAHVHRGLRDLSPPGALISRLVNSADET